MKLLKLESGSTLRDEHWRKKACRTRNSVSRARLKRQSKDLMEWMEETAMAVENRWAQREGKMPPARIFAAAARRLTRYESAIGSHLGISIIAIA